MDSTSKWLNSISIAVSILLGLGVGAYVYRLTMTFVSDGEVALLEEGANIDEVEAFIRQEDSLEEDDDETPRRISISKNGIPVEPAEEAGEYWEGQISDFDDDENETRRRSTATDRKASTSVSDNLNAA